MKGRSMSSLRRCVALAAPVLLLACGGQGTGKVSIRLTDAPGDFISAVVTISRIELVGSGGTVVLSDTPVTTDLLTLANDAVDLVTSAVVPVGNYGQLRFVITGGCIEVEQAGGGALIYASTPGYEGLPEGAVVAGTLKMPSFAESGLKVNLPGGFHVGTDSHVLLVDFDVAQSFGHEAGGSGDWVMHPVVKAVELELSGAVNVSLALAPGVTLPGSATLGQFRAVLTNAGGSAETLPLTDAGGGTFTASFRYLIPGTYSLTFTPAPGVTSFTTDPPVPPTITVASGLPTTASFVVTSAQ
jgi:Domain of unknown function (DUF4382)